MAQPNFEDMADWEILDWVILMDWEEDAKETKAMDDIRKEERY